MGNIQVIRSSEDTYSGISFCPTAPECISDILRTFSRCRRRLLTGKKGQCNLWMDKGLAESVKRLPGASYTYSEELYLLYFGTRELLSEYYNIYDQDLVFKNIELAIAEFIAQSQKADSSVDQPISQKELLMKGDNPLDVGVMQPNDQVDADKWQERAIYWKYQAAYWQKEADIKERKIKELSQLLDQKIESPER